MPSVAVRLDADMKARLEKLADAMDRTPHYFMKEAIREYVESEEWKLKENAIVEERWNHYKLTGESIPHEDVVKNFQTLFEKNRQKSEAAE